MPSCLPTNFSGNNYALNNIHFGNKSISFENDNNKKFNICIYNFQDLGFPPHQTASNLNDFKSNFNALINSYCKSFFKKQFTVTVYNSETEEPTTFTLSKSDAKDLNQKVNQLINEIRAGFTKLPTPPTKPDLKTFTWKTTKGFFGTRNYIVTPDGKQHRIKQLFVVPEKFAKQFDEQPLINQALVNKYNAELQAYEEQCAKIQEESSTEIKDLVKEIANLFTDKSKPARSAKDLANEAINSKNLQAFLKSLNSKEFALMKKGVENSEVTHQAEAWQKNALLEKIKDFESK